MSSILDALKKSEAERQRGLPPTIGSSLPLRRQPPPRKSTRWWLPVAAAAALALAWAGGMFDFASGDAGPDTAASSPDAAPAAASVAVADPGAPANESIAAPTTNTAVPASARSETKPAAAGATSAANAESAGSDARPRRIGFGPYRPSAAAEAPAKPDTAVTPQTAESDPGRSTATTTAAIAANQGTGQPAGNAPAHQGKPAQPQQIAAGTAQSAPTDTPAPSSDTPAIAADAPAAAAGTDETASDDGIPTIYELSFAARQTLPDITVTMHMYSDDPDRRFALVNGVRVSDGQALDGGVEIVRVLPDGVQVRFESTEFVLPVRH